MDYEQAIKQPESSCFIACIKKKSKIGTCIYFVFSFQIDQTRHSHTHNKLVQLSS